MTKIRGTLKGLRHEFTLVNKFYLVISSLYPTSIKCTKWLRLYRGSLFTISLRQTCSSQECQVKIWLKSLASWTHRSTRHEWHPAVPPAISELRYELRERGRGTTVGLKTNNRDQRCRKHPLLWVEYTLTCTENILLIHTDSISEDHPRDRRDNDTTGNNDETMTRPGYFIREPVNWWSQIRDLTKRWTKDQVGGRWVEGIKVLFFLFLFLKLQRGLGV